jgi:amino acid transporter
MKPISRAIIAVLLCLGALAVIAFLVVVDIIDDVSRDQHAWAKAHEPVIQEIPSVKPSEGD